MVLSLSHGDARSTPAPGRQIPVQARPARYVPADAPVAAHRRQGDSAQAAEQDLLPDLRRRARSRAGGRRESAPPRIRLVFSLLSRPRALSEPRHDPHRDVPLRGRRGRRSERAGPPDAFPLGDGTTSEGEFWEALNTATNLKLPVLFLIEDNKYAISVPVEVQTAGGSVSKLVRNFPGLLVEEVDGCDPVVSYDVLLRASEYVRQRKGPALVHAHVTRPYSHSLSDDEVLYKPPKEREEEARRDCLALFPKRLIADGVASAAEIEAIKRQVEEEVGVAADMALASPQPEPETALLYVYSPEVDPTSEQFDTEDDPQFGGDPTTMVDLLNACLKDEMARDPRIVVFGEDVADV